MAHAAWTGNRPVPHQLAAPGTTTACPESGTTVFHERGTRRRTAHRLITKTPRPKPMQAERPSFRRRPNPESTPAATSSARTGTKRRPPHAWVRPAPVRRSRTRAPPPTVSRRQSHPQAGEQQTPPQARTPIPSFRRRPESRTHAVIAPPATRTAPRRGKPHQTPHWQNPVPACAGTTSAVALFRRQSTVEQQTAPSPIVIPAQAGIQNPRRFQHPPRRHPRVRSPINRRTPGLRRYDGLERGRGANRTHKRENSKRPRSPCHHSGAGRNPEPASGTATYALRPTNARSLIKRTSRPNRHPATEAPPSAKLPTDPRRYSDGLARVAPTRANPAQPPTRDLTD